MGTLKIRISDELERKFRETAMRLYGFKKGSLSVAAEKTISAWLSQVSQVMELAEAVGDPVEAIYGISREEVGG
ncbi:MAG: hypothetical protein DRJ57_05530 [Thermoprotei archaeon]|nr:MAG: hypothetical protein DRJ57_05530 [Thermoprotei archaeon]